MGSQASAVTTLRAAAGLIVIALYYILFRPGILIQTKMFEHETVSGFGKMRGSVKILRGLYFARHGSCEHWTLNALSCIHQSSPKRNCEKIAPAPGMQAISQPGVVRFNCHLKLGKKHNLNASATEKGDWVCTKKINKNINLEIWFWVNKDPWRAVK